MTETVSRLYDDYDRAAQAVRDLEAAGFSSDNISLLAANTEGVRSTGEETSEAAGGAETGAGIGGAIGAGAGLLAGIGLLAVPGLGPVVAAGWLASTLVGGVAGAAAGAVTGGLVGALTEAGLDRDEANVYAEGIRRGGTLVSVRVADGRVGEAERILDAQMPVDIATRERIYRDSGWTDYDPEAAPYTQAEIEKERRRFDTMR